jgi:hypothetical protein
MPTYLARDAHSFEAGRRQAPAAQSAHEFAGARDPARRHLRPQRHSAGHRRLGRNWSAIAPITRRSASTSTQACSRFDSRHYPFGAAAAHLIGDLRTGENFHATNASLVEHDSNRKLQGYEYAELAPLVRYRHQPGNPGIARILARDRNVHLTVDIRLQMRARRFSTGTLRGGRAERIGGGARRGHRRRAGAGERARARSAAAQHTPDELLDRARYGEYPPGSTFKLVTAIAALRLDPELKHRTFLCHRLPDGRAGNTIPAGTGPSKTTSATSRTARST